jgi:hypothetical protein
LISLDEFLIHEIDCKKCAKSHWPGFNFFEITQTRIMNVIFWWCLTK